MPLSILHKPSKASVFAFLSNFVVLFTLYDTVIQGRQWSPIATITSLISRFGGKEYNVPIYWTTILGGYGIIKVYEKSITQAKSIYHFSRS
jgi:hypothetical protein